MSSSSSPSQHKTHANNNNINSIHHHHTAVNRQQQSRDQSSSPGGRHARPHTAFYLQVTLCSCRNKDGNLSARQAEERDDRLGFVVIMSPRCELTVSAAGSSPTDDLLLTCLTAGRRGKNHTQRPRVAERWGQLVHRPQQSSHTAVSRNRRACPSNNAGNTHNTHQHTAHK